MAYLFLIIGFILLIKGADCFVDGSSSIALIFKVPSLIIGMTIVAMGTSAPETAVSVSAAIEGKNAIAISNVIGSNFFNLLIVIGLSALISPMSVSRAVIRRDYPINLFAMVSLIVLAILGNMTLTKVDGIILLVFFSVFLLIMIAAALKRHDSQSDTADTQKKFSPIMSIFYILIGLTGIIMGGKMVVDCAGDIALSLGLSQHFIGVTIVSIGTSFPELVTSIVAGIKGENDLAIGNVIGSNIFNLLLIIGLSSSITPLSVDTSSIIDLFILLVVSLIVYIYIATTKKINRLFGTIMILSYILYFIFLCNECHWGF